MYTLDIETMRQIMLAHKKTGYLHADLPSGVPGLREPGRVTIELEAGNVVSCTVTSNRGNLLTGEKAYQELTRLGRLNWTFVPQSPSVTSPRPVTRVLAKKVISRPRRIVLVTPSQMHSWMRIHKCVYGLVDGTRSVADIAELLSTTPEVIEGALHDLRSIGVIVME